MTRAALGGDALFWFLVFMTLLLVMFISAVILALPQSPVPRTAGAQNARATRPMPARRPPAAAPKSPGLDA
jgi:hypothetical protein